MKKLLSLFIFIFLLVSCEENILVQLIVVNYDTINLNVNSEFQVEVNIIPIDASNKELLYIIENDEIASVSSTGLLKAKKLGETNLIIKVKENESINKSIKIVVDEKNWPNDRIKSFSGFELPEFSSYTKVEIEENESYILLKIKGVDNPNETVVSYKDLLVNSGWIVETYDNHSGKLTRRDSKYVIYMHNEYIHNNDYIEFKIIDSTSGVQHKHFNDLQEEVTTLFNITLPDFDGAHVVEYVIVNNTIEGTIEIEGIREEKIAAYLLLLESNQWTKKDGSTNHLGTFVKDDIEFYYHEDHHLDNIIGFKIS